MVSSSIARAKDIVYSYSDSLIYETCVKQLAKQEQKESSALIISAAKRFLGKPYVASTLEISENEKLIINLREFDCTTFVENCIVLSKVVQSEDYSFNNYCSILQAIRYRNGIIDGYISRLHYTSDWIYENQKQGILENISIEIGGKRLHKPVNFMTDHSPLYKHLKNNPRNVDKLKDIERTINDRNCYEIVPLSEIPTNEKKIKNGDIIVFVTSVIGLDYSHMGIAYWVDDKLYFIHASSRMKQVVIEKKTLFEYCKSSKNCSGISVLRISN